MALDIMSGPNLGGGKPVFQEWYYIVMETNTLMLTYPDECRLHLAESLSRLALMWQARKYIKIDDLLQKLKHPAIEILIIVEQLKSEHLKSPNNFYNS